MELKVLILDDEYIILDGLCSFPWESYGCRLVGSAMDGEEGLELARKNHPDIILSDIKMPEMDGLTFSTHIKKEAPETEIIFLTGYDDFAFAQQALQLGACEYLLKPVNFQEMHQALDRICHKVREQKRHKRDYSELRRKYNQTLPLVRSKLIADLIYGRLMNRNDMEVRMNMLNLRIDRYVLVYGRVQGEEEKNKELEPGLFDFVICNICEELFKQEGRQVYSEPDTLGYYFIVVFSKEMAKKDCINHCVQACEKIQKNVQSAISVEISFGISMAETDPYCMNARCQQAVEACEQSVYMGEDSNILEYTDIAEDGVNQWHLTEGEKKRLFSAVARNNIETAKSYAGQIFEECTDIEVMRYAVVELLINCFQYLGKKPVLNESLEIIYSIHNRRELLEYLKKTLGLLADQNRGEQVSHNEQTAVRIMEYIAHNFKEDLSLDILAEYFKISKTYINRLLKNYNGKSFLEVLLDYRMVRAEQLISENKYKVYEVAEMVGYHDFSYFIKAFKKKYGVTPNVYRKI